ncbi:MAG TPA: hypothetical protein VK761_04680 [Solirubrobacteraceae bacterium]|jgi:hypothetical protein|nr:hypothetical protein [Solirubrobacteraceae bacterium]
MDARRVAGLLAGGRVALGAAVLIAPEAVTSRWLGEHARHPAVRYLAHSLGARDAALGALALVSLRSGQLAAAVQLACAGADAADALATVAARNELPPAGAFGTVAVAGAAALVELVLAQQLAAA